ncbi:MAG: glycogen debranching enzyme family protein [Planctomycetes bacterium]|nr:glycogen debranching enzyme family protein [Planctomycetota bacterium]
MNAMPEDREWLEADGLGGFAMGSTQLVRRRRYHALLCTATTPPTGRMVLVAGQDVELRAETQTWPLSAQMYTPGVVHPRGDRLVASFRAGPWPTWEFALGNGRRVRHELFVPRGHAAVVQRWTLVGDAATRNGPGAPGLELVVRPFLAGRDYHALRSEHDGMHVELVPATETVGWRLSGAAPAAGADTVPDVFARGNGAYRHHPTWYRNFLHREETARGYSDREDLLAPGTFHFDLTRGPAVLAMAASDLPPLLRADAVGEAVATMAERERARRHALASPLHRAAEAYVVARGNGRTLVAGYPWFTDWGRDTFVSLRGICLATGDRAAAREILLEWARHVSSGMIPNRFPDQGEVEYHTADAALWFVVAANAYLGGEAVAAADAEQLRRTILAIVEGYAAGTRHGIGMDPVDGLLRAGEPGRQLTWMDAIVDGRVVTPRSGKPVELQALWGNALAIAAGLDARWQTPAQRARWSFAERFWSPGTGHLHDVVDVDHVPGALDSRLRCNQILAIGGLPLPMLVGDRARAVVECVERELYTPMGLRTLARGEPGYVGSYAGDPAARDLAYHNGTVWPWLLGPFVEAWLRVHGTSPLRKAEAHRRFVQPLLRHLDVAGIGHVSEIADGTTPHTPRGCPFQAWSLGELLRLELQVLADRSREPTPPTERLPRPAAN